MEEDKETMKIMSDNCEVSHTALVFVKKQPFYTTWIYLTGTY